MFITAQRDRYKQSLLHIFLGITLYYKLKRGDFYPNQVESRTWKCLLNNFIIGYWTKRKNKTGKLHIAFLKFVKNKSLILIYEKLQKLLIWLISIHKNILYFLHGDKKKYSNILRIEKSEFLIDFKSNFNIFKEKKWLIRIKKEEKNVGKGK